MIESVKGVTSPARDYALNPKAVSEDKPPAGDDVAAVLELGNEPPAHKTIYSRPALRNVDRDEINRLIEETERSYQGLRDLIERLISRQGKRYDDLIAGKDTLKIDDETREIAENALMEDGMWGVEAVSDRLLAFAKAISGGDKSKYEEIRGAIEKGFKEAERVLGGSLPEISQRTYEATMKKLDDWAKSDD